MRRRFLVAFQLICSQSCITSAFGLKNGIVPTRDRSIIHWEVGSSYSFDYLAPVSVSLSFSCVTIAGEIEVLGHIHSTKSLPQSQLPKWL